MEEAVAFAQSSLAPLRGLLSSRQSVSDAMLHEVVALLAYEDPMVSFLNLLHLALPLCEASMSSPPCCTRW